MSKSLSQRSRHRQSGGSRRSPSRVRQSRRASRLPTGWRPRRIGAGLRFRAGPHRSTETPLHQLSRHYRNNISLASSVGGYDDFVFLTRKGFPLSSATLNSALTKAVDAINGERKLAGEEIIFPHVSCHWFRRTFATRLCESDVSLRVAQYVLGHADANITASIYTAVNEELAATEMEKLIKKGVFREKTPLQLTYYQLSRFSQQTARYRHDTSRGNSLLTW